MNSDQFRDIVFKGCTRPAMFLGVPLIPLLSVAGTILLIASLTTILVNLILVPVILVMGQITRTDDQQYRLLSLRLYCRLIHPNRNARFWCASAYAPIAYRSHR